MLSSACDATIKLKCLVHWKNPSLNLFRCFSCSGPVSPSKNEILRCYQILKVSEDCNIEDIRIAFISLAKQYHPDSGSADADVEKFKEVESAYRLLHAKLSEEQKRGSMGEPHISNNAEEFDIQHTAPQHRQYLSYDGYGSGTPSQRLKQYQKQRAMTAADNVMAHRVRQLNLNCSHNREEALAVKDKTESRKIKTRYGMDRLVEDLIQESMAKGDFDNLSGKGKPLKQGIANPYVDFTTHKINEVLIDNGFTPEWIVLQKEVREERDHIRQYLTKQRKTLGPLPLSNEEEDLWKLAIENCRPLVQQLNSKINKYNLLVPILEKQMLQVQLDKEASKILHEIQGENLKTETPQSDFHKDRGSGIFSFFQEIFGK